MFWQAQMGHKMSQVLLRKGKNGPVIEKICDALPEIIGQAAKAAPTLHSCKPPYLYYTSPRNQINAMKFPYP